MSKNIKLIKELEKYNITSFEPLKSKINTLDSIEDILYNANISIFQTSSINHKERLKLLWAWTIPDLFPGAVEQGLVASEISWLTSFKLAIFFGILTGAAKGSNNN